MAVMDFAGVEQHSNQYDPYNMQFAANELRSLPEDNQVISLINMPLSQATEVLGEYPLKRVLTMLDRMEEQGEDVRMREISTRLGLISSEAEPTGHYLQNGVLIHVRERIGWIVGLALMGILSGLIIAEYEDALNTLMLLAIYMPVVAAAGGNTGSQAPLWSFVRWQREK